MRETYVLTVLLYNSSTCHMLDLIVHIHEFIKARVKSEYNKLNGEYIEVFCKTHRIIGIEDLKDVRDAYVHHMNEFEYVGVTVSSLRLETLMSALNYFGVECDEEFVRSEVIKVHDAIEYWCSNIGEV